MRIELGKTVNNILMCVAVVAVLGSQGRAAMTPYFSAKINDLKDRSKVMFDYKNEFEVVGDTKTSISTWTDDKGAVVVTEKSVFKIEGGKEKLVSFEKEQKQEGTSGKIEIVGDEAKFTYIKDGKTKTASEKVTDNFIVSSMVVPYLKANWETIAKGETLKVRFAVIDRLETVGFSYYKEADREIQGKPGVVVKMKPSSMIISALVDPLHFGFSADGSDLLELEGRVAPKVNKDGKWKDFDGYTVYTYAPPAAPEVKAANASAPDAKTENNASKKASKKKEKPAKK